MLECICWTRLFARLSDICPKKKGGETMLIGIILLVYGGLFYVLIKPPTFIQNNMSLSKNEERIGERLSYKIYKGIRHLVLPKGLHHAKAKGSRSGHDNEVKPNA